MSVARVAVVAPPWYPVPPVGYGGTELVVALLVRSLRAQGIDVVLYAAEGSAEPAVELAPPEWSIDLMDDRHLFREAAYMGRVLADLEARDVDVIHDHSGWVGLVANGFSGLAPTLHTAHLPILDEYRLIYEAVAHRVDLVAISDAQRATAPELNWAGRVYNAVDIDALPLVEERDDYLLCLARISPQKGQHHAIEVAWRTGRRLILAGKVGELPGDRPYFDSQIAPHIDGDRVVYLDNVAGAEKAALLGRASALLAPLRWAEPFGLAMVEAMATGTPVIAMRCGSTPELIEHGRTGFLADSVDGLVEATAQLHAIDPRECADQARRRFSPQTMAAGYLELYEAAAAGTRIVELPGVEEELEPVAAALAD